MTGERQRCLHCDLNARWAESDWCYECARLGWELRATRELLSQPGFKGQPRELARLRAAHLAGMLEDRRG